MKKLNKKGFTLIELLAVIAILSILIVVAFPGVISLYNSAKQNTFKTQAQSIWRSIEQQIIKNTLEGNSYTCYSGGSGLEPSNPTGSFELTGNVRYKATVSASGTITSLAIQQMNGSTVVYDATTTDGKNITINTTVGTAITPCT